MSTVICNKPCKFRKAVFCGRDFVMLNQFGMCDIWFDKNGQMRMVPNYPIESEPQAADEQQLPHEQNIEPKMENKEEEEISNCLGENERKEAENDKS